MAYGKVEERFWHDRTIRDLPESARVFMLYLLTCPHRNRLGCFALDTYYAAADLQWPPEQVTEAMAKLVEVGRIMWDRDNRLVFLRRYFRHNTLENPNVVKGALADLKNLTDSPLIRNLLEAVEENHPSHYVPLIKALRNRLPNCSANGLPNHGLLEPSQAKPFPEPSLSSGGGYARELQAYLGDQADVVLQVPTAKREIWAQAFIGLYVGTETRAPTEEQLVSQVPKNHRPNVIATALLRFVGEGQHWNGAFFKGILRKVVSEYVKGDFQAPDFGDETQRDVERAVEARNRTSQVEMEASRKDGEEAVRARNKRREWLDALDESERNTVAAEIEKRARQIKPTGKLPTLLVDGCLAAVYDERMEVTA